MRLAGVVTLYHPDDEVFGNILSYADALDMLYVCDNSEEPAQELGRRLEERKNVRYLAFGENKGIAYPLNQVLKEAGDCDWLLTMDQDSRFREGVFCQYLRAVQKILQQKTKCGAFAVRLSGDEPGGEPFCQEVPFAVTSGSLIHVRTALQVGGFDEALFIDEVDHEFCYRLRLHGYKILRVNSVVMEHSIGHSERRRFLWMAPVVYHHPPIRKYYITRNRIYVQKKYPEVRKRYLYLILKNFITVLLYETQKAKKIRYMLRGLYDGLSGRMGKWGQGIS